MKTLAALIVALSIAPPCTAQSAAPVTLRPVLQQLRSEFDTHRETLGATDALTTVKHGLRDWVESRLMTAPQNVDTRAFAAALHVALRDGQFLCVDFAGDCSTNELGYVDDVRVNHVGEFISVVTAVGINCGYDESAYAYAWQNGRWQRFWDSEQNSYTKESYRPQQVYYVLISPPGAGGRRLLATLGSQSGCLGGFKDLYARAWRLDAALAPTRALDWSAYADDGYPPIQGRIRPDDLLVQYTTGGLADGDTHTAVRHFEVRNGVAVQTDPIAGRPHDFVLEWLSAPWEDSRTRAASEALKEPYTALHLEHPYGDFAEATRRCTAGADLWQVATRILDGPMRYYRVRWEIGFRFTMVDISETPFQDCTVEDPRSEVYPPFLTRDLLNP
ncbi:MAG: hypothetical protein DMF87_23565 [Acidobacteria bacterium]|nr:MAG: hypothetical protein DMF87_23565 [Acidobacteriota bacterium]